MEETTAYEKKKKNIFIRIILFILKLAAIIGGLIWIIGNFLSTVAYYWFISVWDNLFGTNLVEEEAEAVSDIGPFDWFFDDWFFAVIVVGSFSIAFLATLVLTKKRSVFSIVGLIAGYMLPVERVFWGTVRDKATGEAIASAVVRIVLPDEEKKKIISESVTDLDGKYRMQLSKVSDKMKIEVSAYGYSSIEDHVDYVPAADGTFDIIQDISLSKSKDKSGYSFLAYYRPGFYKFLFWLVYASSIISAITFIVYLYAYPGSTYGALALMIYGFAVIWNTVIVIQRNRNASGRIVDGASKKPLEGAFVNLYYLGKEDAAGVEVTNKDGIVRFKLPPGEYSAIVSKTGYKLNTQPGTQKSKKVRINNSGFLSDNFYLYPEGNASGDSTLSNPFATASGSQTT